MTDETMMFEPEMMFETPEETSYETPEEMMDETPWKKETLKVMTETEYDPESSKKRLKSARKMVNDALEEIDWDVLEKLMESYHDGYTFYHFQASTHSRLKLVFSPFNWAQRCSFYMYNHYIYTEPCTSHQLTMFDSLSLEDRQRMRMIRRQAVNNTLELVAHQNIPEVAARGGCQIVDHVRNSPQLGMTKIAGMACKGSLAGVVGLAACYASLRLNKPVH